MSGIPSWASAGAPVVCVKTYRHQNDAQRKFAPNLPIARSIYHIRTAGRCPVGGTIVLTFVELVNLVVPRYDEEPGFNIEDFRPVVTRSHEQDMAIFRPILDQVPERVG